MPDEHVILSRKSEAIQRLSLRLQKKTSSAHLVSGHAKGIKAPVCQYGD